MNLLETFAAIKIFVFDVDGVFTNSSVYVNEFADNYKQANVHDGFAVQYAISQGYEIIIISGADIKVYKPRLIKLGVTKIYGSVQNKKELLTQIFGNNSLELQQCLYMGDDLPDINAMQMCGLSAAPKNAVAEVKQIASYISPYFGGEGAVRDVIQKTLSIQGKWNTAVFTAAIGSR